MPPIPTTALIVAAGAGLRMGLSAPKAFADLAGRPMVEHSLALFDGHPQIDTIVLMAPATHLAEARRIAARYRKVTQVLAGGARRQETVAIGLRAIDARDVDSLILIHDAARPLVDAALVTAVIEAAARSGAAIPGLPPCDTVRQVSAGAPPGPRVAAETIDRDRLVLVQTPQGFRRAVLVDAYALPDQTVTDDAALAQRAGHPVEVVPGSAWNMKVTTPADLEMAAALLRARAAGAAKGGEKS